MQKFVICFIKLIMIISVPAQASVVFFDGDFSSGWNDITDLVYDDFRVPGPAPLTSTSSVMRETIGGNPNAFRKSTINWVFGDVILSGGINQNALYEPTNLAIASIDMSIDVFANIVDPVDTNGNPVSLASAPTVGWEVVLEQGGIQYFSTTIMPSSTPNWVTLPITDLVATDFVSFLGTNPDFSSDGAPITFGYALGHGSVPENQGTPSLILVHGADNWSVTINPVPIPSTIFLFSTGLVGLMKLIRKNRKI